MRGSVSFIVRNKRVKYEMTFQRSVSIIKGNSGTGKTALLSMLREYLNLGKSSGISVSTNTSSFRVLEGRSDWESELTKFQNTVYFVDEDVRYVLTKQFADLLFQTGSYLVYITRSGRTGYLSYAISDIYMFCCTKESSFYSNILYNKYSDEGVSFRPDVILTEDSTSGKDIIDHSVEYVVQSTFGKDNVVSSLVKYARSNINIYIIVDGAAFGNQIEKLLRQIDELVSNNIYVFAPECFEYLVLQTSYFKRYCRDILQSPSDYIESNKFKTWENYFGYLLEMVCSTKLRRVAYKKVSWDKLNEFFKSEGFLKQIKKLLPDLEGNG